MMRRIDCLLTAALLALHFGLAGVASKTFVSERQIGSGSITSPKYPDSYPANANCAWLLIAWPKEGNITVAFKDLETEPNHDFVELFDGNTLVYRGSGSEPPFNVTLGHRVTVRFTADDAVSNLGFSLSWYTGTSCQSVPMEYFDRRSRSCQPCHGPGNQYCKMIRNCSLFEDAQWDCKAPVANGVDRSQPPNPTAAHQATASDLGADKEELDLRIATSWLMTSLPQHNLAHSRALTNYESFYIFLGGFCIVAAFGVCIYFAVSSQRKPPAGSGD